MHCQLPIPYDEYPVSYIIYLVNVFNISVIVQLKIASASRTV